MSASRWISLSLAAACLVGCTTRVPGSLKVRTSAGPQFTVGQSDEKPATTPVTSTPAPTTTAAPADLQRVNGTVTGLDGLPAAGVQVQARLSADARAYGLAATAGLSALTDPAGRFTLAVPGKAAFTVEAASTDGLKAIRLGITAGTGDVDLSLNYPGTITGRVTAPSQPAVTNFEGVDVYIPGTSIVGKTSADGQFSLADVPVGSFWLVVAKSELGRAEARDVAVTAKGTTAVGELALGAPTASLTSVSPAIGRPGTVVTITGSRFGASTGATLSVTIGGAAASSPIAVDDGTIRATIPNGASSGDVFVTVDGHASNTLPITIARPRADAKTLTLAGSGDSGVVDGLGTSAAFGRPMGVAIGSDGRLYVADSYDDNIRLLTPETSGAFDVTTYSGPKELDIADEHKDGTGAQARYGQPLALALAADGRLFVADGANHCVRVVTPGASGPVTTTLAGIPGEAGGADGPGVSATFDTPSSVVIDGKGDLLVGDMGNNTIRKITLGNSTHPVTTVIGDADAAPGKVDGFGKAARFAGIHGMAFGADGALYLADTDNNLIRRVELLASGAKVTTYAGSGQDATTDGKGTGAAFSGPLGLAIDASGTIFVTESTGNVVRRLDPDPTGVPVVTVLAGGGLAPQVVDGDARSATFNEPTGLAIDALGNLIVTEGYGKRVRQIVLYDH